MHANSLKVIVKEVSIKFNISLSQTSLGINIHTFNNA